MRAIEGTKGPGRTLTLVDIVTLIQNIVMGAQNPAIGFEDAKETIDSILRKLNATSTVDLAVLESALWSCNLRDEKQEFWDCKGRTFDEFLKDTLGSPKKFDKFYNSIKEY
jgi:hypothetical protein